MTAILSFCRLDSSHSRKRPSARIRAACRPLSWAGSAGGGLPPPGRPLTGGQNDDHDDQPHAPELEWPKTSCPETEVDERHVLVGEVADRSLMGQ